MSNLKIPLLSHILQSSYRIAYIRCITQKILTLLGMDYCNEKHCSAMDSWGRLSAEWSKVTKYSKIYNLISILHAGHKPRFEVRRQRVCLYLFPAEL